MYVHEEQEPVFGAEFQTQKINAPPADKRCAALLKQTPWASGCASCAKCAECPKAADCPAAVDCPAVPDMTQYVAKSDVPSGGLRWWWLLVAAAGGIVVGAVGASMMSRKP